MLNERRNCFLGLINGLEGRRLWPPIGDPFRTALLLNPEKLDFERGGPIIEVDGLLADCGRRSCGGESMKHSSKDIDVDVESLLLPAPKRKGGNWLSGLLRCGIEFVEYPFVRAREGRRRIDFFLLHHS